MRQGAAGGARSDSPPSSSPARAGGRRKARRAGPARQREGEKGRWVGPGDGKGWASDGVLGLGEKEKKKEREWAGLEERKGKRKVLHFRKMIQTIQFKFKFKRTQIRVEQQARKIMRGSMKCTKPIFPYIYFVAK